ncbi:hypothetical protein ABPG77_002135 [Micractinium sp. CCAP 211/92]
MASALTCPQRLRLLGPQLARSPGPPRHIIRAPHRVVRAGAATGVWGPPAPSDDGSSCGESSDPAGGESSRNGGGAWHIQDDHLLTDHAGSDPTVAVHGGTANGNGKQHHLPSSLFASFPKLPPDGSTLTPEEMKCDPDMEHCRTPIHVWESKCRVCAGTGTARSQSSRRRRSVVAVCLLCHGLGYVRHSSTRAATVPYVNGTGPHTTIGRPPPEERDPPRQRPPPGGMQYRPPPQRP